MYFGFRVLAKNQFASRHWRKYENNFRLHQRRFCRLRSSKYSHLMLIQTFYQMLLVHKVLSKTQSAFIGKQEYFTSLYMRENHCLTTIELDVYDYIFFKWKPNKIYQYDSNCLGNFFIAANKPYIFTRKLCFFLTVI